MRLMVTRQRTDPVRTQKFILVKHDCQDTTKFALVENGKEPTASNPDFCRIMKSSTQLGRSLNEGLEHLRDFWILREQFRLKRCCRTKGQQAYHRANLDALHSAVGGTQDIVEETILLVPHAASTQLN